MVGLVVRVSCCLGRPRLPSFRTSSGGPALPCGGEGGGTARAEEEAIAERDAVGEEDSTLA